MGTYDNAYDDYQVAKGESRRAFTYLTLGGARFLYATGARLAAMKFVSSISASADVLALAAMEVDVTKINPGSTITVKWRGKPVFIRNRTAEEIAEAEGCDLGELRDVETDAERLADATKPECWLFLGYAHILVVCRFQTKETTKAGFARATVRTMTRRAAYVKDRLH